MSAYICPICDKRHRREKNLAECSCPNHIYVVIDAWHNQPEFWTDKKEEVDKFIIDYINREYKDDDPDKEFWLKFYEDEGYLEDVWDVKIVPRYSKASPL